MEVETCNIRKRFVFLSCGHLLPRNTCMLPQFSHHKGSCQRPKPPCGNTLQSVNKDTYSTSPAERFVDPDHSKVFTKVTKSKQQSFMVRKTEKSLKWYETIVWFNPG